MNQAASELLDRMIKERQALISSGTLQSQLQEFKEKYPDEYSDPRYDFLDAVNLYDRSVKAGMKSPQQYIDLLEQFTGIDTGSNTQLRFYVPNYALLCARNAGTPHDNEVPKYFQQAETAASNLPDDERDEALGHLHYNVARWLHKKECLEEAIPHWKSASMHRLTFYGLLKAAGNEPYDRLLAAAQQVAKMRSDFPAFFKDKDVDECGVEAKILDELKADFPKDLDKFSAKP